LLLTAKWTEREYEGPRSLLILRNHLEEFRRAIGTGQGFVPRAVSCMRFRILGTYDNIDVSHCNWSDSDLRNERYLRLLKAYAKSKNIANFSCGILAGWLNLNLGSLKL